MQTAFAFPWWRAVVREYAPAARLADGHYSRQSIGAKGFIPPGRCIVLWHEGRRGDAVWGCVLNRFRGLWRWRNTIFRNLSGVRSSVLVAAATDTTYTLWIAKYGALPSVPLRTEIDIEATRVRRSSSSSPGHCYLMAGWSKVRDVPRGHGRSAKVELEAPKPWGSKLAV